MSKAILFVDDDQVFLRVISRAMSSIGYIVYTASTIEAAKEVLNSRHLHFAIVDFHLGDENGNDLIEYVADQFPETQAIVLSGYANVQSAVASIKLGAEDCLPKPIDAEEIDRVLRRLSGDSPVNPESWGSPEEIRVRHIINYWEKNGRNVSDTARQLNMHRRILQRILRRAGLKDKGRIPDGGMKRFQMLRQRYLSQLNSILH